MSCGRRAAGFTGGFIFLNAQRPVGLAAGFMNFGVEVSKRAGCRLLRVQRNRN